MRLGFFILIEETVYFHSSIWTLLNVKVLVTGAAGFIGFHLVRHLLRSGVDIWGVDNLNNYYDTSLKRARLAEIEGDPRFEFTLLDLADSSQVNRHFEMRRPDIVVHLAAQAGVRYSMTNPNAYVHSNLLAFVNVLQSCANTGVRHLVYASSSSVYGANTKVPFAVGDDVDHPISFYAATKRANELFAHSFSHLYGLPTTGLRFFTVYGPWGRPDMAYCKFAHAIAAGQPIDLYNYGEMQRDFTYVDDVVEGIRRLIESPPTQSLNQQHPGETFSRALFNLYNIGNSNTVELLYFVQLIEKAFGRKARKRFLPMQEGDVPRTYAQNDELFQAVGFRPATPVEEGIPRFVEWYQKYYSAAARWNQAS